MVFCTPSTQLSSHGDAFRSLFRHLQDCDPSSTLVPLLVGCSKLTEFKNPPIGPTSQLPKSVEHITRLLRGLKPRPDGTDTRCEIVLQHSLDQATLLCLLNQAHQGRHYIFQEDPRQSSYTDPPSTAWTFLQAVPVPVTSADLSLLEQAQEVPLPRRRHTH